ncbi:MAG: DNA polymerase III subunit gamma/tau [Isosphaeraceae bacterium]
MPDPEPAATAPAAVDGSGRPAGASGYTVVARRYRPQRFEDVVGQDHVVQALRNAIRLNRLAQAYLFCGTRGVGKTSMARIFAKCLNCVRGPTEDPCQVCDNCQMIAAGQDVDVIEIDGASNNGVEQVRELRQNASLRPSRSRFKIYYIDEVHMLSTGAFNALLKTLEEPPPHVKFFFATTEVNKIPITVLSRCQRYDFAGITPEAIVATLKEICDRERVESESEALQVVARRAGGSMRDAQSLLEQLLASGSPKLTVEVVHALLGTPSDERLLAMLEALAEHRTSDVLSLVDRAAAEGVQPSDFLSGVLEFLRDAMVLSVGAGSILLAVTPRQKPHLQRIVDGWSTDAILASLQILAEARSRMRGVAHGRLLAEIALARVARLENLSDLGELVQRLERLESGGPEPRRIQALGAKKKPRPEELTPGSARESAEPGGRPAHPDTTADSGQAAGAVEVIRAVGLLQPVAGDAKRAAPADHPAPVAENAGAPGERPGRDTALDDGAGIEESGGEPLDLQAIRRAWPDLVKKVGPALGIGLVATEPVAVEPPDLLVFAAKPGYNSSLPDLCGTQEAREQIERSLRRSIRRRVRVRYQSLARSDAPRTPADVPGPGRPDLLAADPMIQKVVELFEARPFHLEYESAPE